MAPTALRGAALLALCGLGASGINNFGAGNAGLDLAKRGEALGQAANELRRLYEARDARDGDNQQPYWASKNGDSMRTGDTKVIVPTNLTKGPSWSWVPPDGGLVRATPLFDGDSNIYLATINGELRKLKPTGELIWSHQETSSIPSVPAILGNLIYLGCENGDTVALDTATGKVVWRTPSSFMGKDNKASGLDTWSMAAGDGVVLGARIDPDLWSWGGGNNHIVAFDAATGKQLWDYVVPELVYNILCDIVDGSVVFADQRGTPHRLNLTTGQVMWIGKRLRRAGWSTGGAVVGPNKVVYVTSNVLNDGVPDPNTVNVMGFTLTLMQTGRLTAYDLASGTLKWSTTLLDLPGNSGPAVGRIGGDREGQLSVVMGSGPNPEPPTAFLQSVPKPSRVLAVDAETGKIQWSFDLPYWHGKTAGDSEAPVRICMPDSFSNPAIAGDGTVFIGSMTGRVYAINNKDGDGTVSAEKGEVTFFDAKAGFQGSPGLAPGVLAVTPCDSIHVFLGGQYGSA